MTFLNKNKINLFLGSSFLIFISIFSISNVEMKNRSIIEIAKLNRNQSHEIKSIDPKISPTKTLKDKIDTLQTSIAEWTRYASSGKTYITYYIQEGMREGNIQGKYVTISAHSGGGALAGKNYVESVDSKMMDNVCSISQRVTYLSRFDNISSKERGGPIVPGIYILAPDIGGTCTKLNKRLCENRYVELIPDLDTRNIISHVGRRGGFRIHFRGGIGSDECIVPEEYGDFTRLLNQVKNTHGGTLIVKKSKSEVISCGNSLIDNI